MLAVILVFLGGGAGTLSRYVIGRFVGERWTRMFPLGTCAINVTGCFFLGCLETVASTHAHTGLLIDLLATGFLGGYTAVPAGTATPGGKCQSGHGLDRVGGSREDWIGAAW